MSVIHFSTHELGNVAKVVAERCEYTPFAEMLKKVANDLHTISLANSKCYEFRYGEKAPAITVGAIVPFANKTVKGDLDRAVRTVGLFRYNCQENVDYLAEQEGGYQALADLLLSLLDAQGEHVEAQRKQLNELLGSNLQIETQTF